jgi:hypothetical protein
LFSPFFVLFFPFFFYERNQIDKSALLHSKFVHLLIVMHYGSIFRIKFSYIDRIRHNFA